LQGFIGAKSTNSPKSAYIAPESPKPTEGLETQNSSPVYFERGKQFSFFGGGV